METENVATSGANDAVTAAIETSASAETIQPDNSNLSPAEIEERDLNASLSAAFRNSQKTRGDGGRYAPDENSGKPDEVPANESKPAPPVTTREMPVSWKSRPFEKVWSSLTPDAQDAILTREAEANTGFEKFRAKYEPYEGIDQVFAPRASLLQKYNMTPTQAVDRLLQAQEALERDPVNGIATLARQYGIDLTRLNAGQPQRPVDPQTNYVMQELQALKAKEAQREAAALADQESSLKAEIAAFERSEGLEFLADVRADMAAILAKDFAQGDTTQAVLRDAYEKAVWQNPTTRARALEKESEKRMKQQQAEEQKKAAASGLNVRGAVNAGHPAINEDQMLSDVYRKVTARRN